jgi:hypothetical protein
VIVAVQRHHLLSGEHLNMIIYIKLSVVLCNVFFFIKYKG